MPDTHWLDEADARRLRAALLTGALPIRVTLPLTFVVHDTPTEWLALQLDATGRLDVADAFRVIAAAGMQSHSQAHSRYLFCEGCGYMELTFTIAAPVTCRFKVVVTWPAQRHVFDAMLRCAGLLVTTGRVRRLLDGGTLDTGAIGLRIDHAEVGQFMAVWRHYQEEGE
jgi:hypothetical protein